MNKALLCATENNICKGPVAERSKKKEVKGGFRLTLEFHWLCPLCPWCSWTIWNWLQLIGFWVNVFFGINCILFMTLKLYSKWFQFPSSKGVPSIQSGNEESLKGHISCLFYFQNFQKIKESQKYSDSTNSIPVQGMTAAVNTELMKENIFWEVKHNFNLFFWKFKKLNFPSRSRESCSILPLHWENSHGAT